MDIPAQSSESPIPQPVSVDPLSPRVGGRLSSNRDIAVVQADYMALANDLAQAQSLAASLEIELSGKTNELANFKHVWERTQADLAKLERDIEELRKERHALANQAQRGQAYEYQFEKQKKLNTELQAKVGNLETELSAERAAHASARLELADLKELLPVSPSTGEAAPASAELRELLFNLKAKLDQVLANPALKNSETTRPSSTHPPAQKIEITYE